ncbi:hypothetical protein QZH41_002664 [Actinostola sp. cb2023]|nr:hypothetical protein QZH41_002664 [Actinostola sp. cb2023]
MPFIFFSLILTYLAGVVMWFLIAAIQNSSEHRIGILKNGKINHVQQYYSVSDIHDALVQREVKGALIDTYVVAAKAQMFTDEGIRVAKMLERAFGYGVALSSGISALETECLQYLKVNAEKMTRLIDQSTSKLTVSRDTVRKAQVSRDTVRKMFVV